MTVKKPNSKPGSLAVAATIVVLYDGFDVLDVAGPFAFLQGGGLNPVLAGVEKRNYRSGEGIEFVAQYGFDDAAIKEMLKGRYLIWIPGGYGDDFVKQFQKGNPLFKWLAAVAPKAKLMTSVCTGALIAAAAGVINGCEATTNWAFKGSLELFSKKNKIKVAYGYPRYVHDKKRKVVTGGGVSSGLDESLYLVSLLGTDKDSTGDEKAMRTQLINQYAPFLQFDAGIPATAPEDVVKYIRTEVIDDYCKTQLNPAIRKFLK